MERSFDLLDLHAYRPDRYPHLLQSSVDGPPGSYDILFAFPGESLIATSSDESFFEQLEGWWNREKSPPVDCPELPFCGGWFIYLGYEIAGEVEPSLDLPESVDELPVAIATRIPAAVIRDRGNNVTYICGETQALIRDIEQDVQNIEITSAPGDALAVGKIHEDPDEDYLSSVKRILSYIVEGDVFQVNLSRLWKTTLLNQQSHAAIYAQLRTANPGPFNGLASWGNKAIFSSSPERLVSVTGDLVETRPIAGTRPRGNEYKNDQALSSELLDHPKERAEHIMLIDLGRNDLGRIAVPGTVHVDELMTLESYATVHHIVSNVSAQKRADVTPIDVIKAVFPGGTITGCPKVRCMEIIAEQEKTGRGPYTGSMGYLGVDGRMDLNILIRTIVREDKILSFRAGAGIVADSDPDFELAETRAKAQGMLRALGVTGQ